jgi:hypothetical protein
MDEFDSIVIGHVEWHCACRAPSSRSRVGGGPLLLVVATMYRLLALYKERRHCRVAIGVLAMIGVASLFCETMFCIELLIEM